MIETDPPRETWGRVWPDIRLLHGRLGILETRLQEVEFQLRWCKALIGLWMAVTVIVVLGLVVF